MPVIDGLEIKRLESGLSYISRYVGEPNVPSDIKRLRRSVWEMTRRFGQPVVVKHMYNPDDEEAGNAEKSANFHSVYGQTRHKDPLSHGIGYVSTVESKDEWIAPDGTIVSALVRPSSAHVAAPRYRGFGPGFLTYAVEPDVAEDVFKLDPTGVLIKVQNATAQSAWYPEINDNDLVVNVVLNKRGEIVDEVARFVAKMTNPITMRGQDRRARPEYSGDEGNRHVINQQFEMTRLPENNALQRVELDR